MYLAYSYLIDDGIIPLKNHASNYIPILAVMKKRWWLLFN